MDFSHKHAGEWYDGSGLEKINAKYCAANLFGHVEIYSFRQAAIME